MGTGGISYPGSELKLLLPQQPPAGFECVVHKVALGAMASHAWGCEHLSVFNTSSRSVWMHRSTKERMRVSKILLGAQERLVAYQGKLVTVQDVSGEVANGTGKPHAGNSNPYISTARSPQAGLLRRSVLCAVRLRKHAPGPAPH